MTKIETCSLIIFKLYHVWLFFVLILVLSNCPRLCPLEFVDSGKGYGSLTELTEVPGTGMKFLQNSQKFRVLCGNLKNSQKFQAGI